MADHTLFGSWETFYVIAGGAAAALTGLQFVVIAIVADSSAAPSSHAISGFASPTIVHFCVVLLVSAIVAAPWSAISSPALALTLTGAGSTLYTLWSARHLNAHPEAYTPVTEDWVWYAILPTIAYVALLAFGILAWRNWTSAPFGIAAVSLALLFLGIRNAWDTVTYIAVEQRQQQRANGGTSAS